MLNLYTISTNKEGVSNDLALSEKISVLYHSLFDYPLNIGELIKWQVRIPISLHLDSQSDQKNVIRKNGFYFIEGCEGIIYKRLLRKRISAKKMKIAKKAAHVLSYVPGVRMVAVTGSLAMENASEDSDIDLMIITKTGKLWTTRMLSYITLRILGRDLRKPKDTNQKDKLCLNMWLDECDLMWPKKDRNLYSAHEIAQIVVLEDKDKIYQRLLKINKWILSFWPNAVKIKNSYITLNKTVPEPGFVERMAFKLQYSYMKNKISREVVTPTRALFHPQDWGKVVLNQLTY